MQWAGVAWGRFETYKCRAGAGTLLLAAHEEHDGDKEAWQPRRVERRSVDSV